ncbi:MAG: hypothetical protein ACR652_11985 [Methylocystis sp.]|uniref:hypothetical protein n=1 Tax=Methylocystis sp. TaxID=1911079 RepID=UPI003DA67705
MTDFTFEYAQFGEAPLVSETVDIAHRSAVWCHVEALALRLGERPGAFIRVRDDKGQAVVRAGVATALASIRTCPCRNCPVKSGAPAATGPLVPAPAPCRNAGVCACGAIGD